MNVLFLSSLILFTSFFKPSAELTNLQYSSISIPTNISPNSLESDECQIFCLQPDSRLCQCSKEELNKYIPASSFDLSTNTETNSTSITNPPNQTSLTLPHIYQSQKEKQTCGEYTISIRKLNIALSIPYPNSYFEPSLDFQITSPTNHSISSLFFWGDFVALYDTNPYVNYTRYLKGCIWQIPSGSNSYHSTIESKICRKSLIESIINQSNNMHLCVWSYERFWNDIGNGPCLCCEINIDSCKECHKCFNQEKDEDETEDKISRCLGEGDLDCYKCLNFKAGSFNCQSYEYFLLKMLKEAKGYNKYTILTKNQKTLIDNL